MNEPTERTDIVGACGSDCPGDLVPVIADGAWSAERCTKCRKTWWYQVPRPISQIEPMAAVEAADRANENPRGAP